MEYYEQYPLIPLRDLVIFPNMIAPVFVGREKSVKAVEIADSTDRLVFFTYQKDNEIDEPEYKDLHKVGTLGRLLQVLKLPDGAVKILVEGVKRGELQEINDKDGALNAEIELRPDQLEMSTNTDVYREMLLDKFEEFIDLSKKVSPNILESFEGIDDLRKVVNMVASNMPVGNSVLQKILEIDDILDRVEELLGVIESEIELTKLDGRIKSKVKKQMTKAQREYYLGEQMKAINKELGRDEDYKAEHDEIEEKLKNDKIPEEVKAKADREFKKFKMMQPTSAESTVVRNYLEWILGLPWGEYTEDILDILKAEEVLERDHYGLEKAKDRIIEFLSVRKIAPEIKGPILCFAGPPGVGKTSLARSIAEAMGRKFVRMSLGGVRDEAEVRGHRKTYIGSLPGKIIQSIKKSGSMNPVFLLDEIDKLASDYRGDPSSALLEALDPEQNSTFMDHYLEVEFDLSKVFFITTANDTGSIPPALRDRMEIIRIPGYTEMEKFKIAEKFLLPKQLKEHNLTKEQVNITGGAVTSVIREYTKEAGVRNLEREIASLIRKSARKIVSGKQKTVRVTANGIEKFLGIKRFRFDELREERGVGIATGLAWTPYGGDILQIEIATFTGTGKLQITGKLGDVMQESVKTALSAVKSRATELKIPAHKFSSQDIHVHVPEGAVPKDGPSAGVTIATALASVLSGKEVNCRIAMTGEITLRGKVLPVGGIKEKVLAAHRLGLKDIILPESNKKDLSDIPADVKSKLKFIHASDIDDVFAVVFNGKK